MNKRAIVLMFFLCTLCIGLLISCERKAVPPEKDPTVFSVLYNDRQEAPFQNEWMVLDAYKQAKGANLDVHLGDDADYGNAVLLAMESGNIPDIILKVWPKTIETYANAGLLLAFSDYMDQMPYFKAYIKSHELQDELDALRMKDGKFYILPGYQRQVQVQQWIYRKDIFEKHGLAIPDTYDELFNSLVYLKGISPDSVPISGAWGGAHLLTMIGAGYGIPAGWAGTLHYNEETDLWEYAPATENYKAMLKFLNRCYVAGVLDAELFTQTDADYYQKLLDGRMLVGVTWITSGFDNWDSQLHANGIPDGKWVPFMVPESTIGIRAVPAVNPFRKGLMVPSRVANEPYFKDLLAFLDWAVYSDEGQTLTYWGIEGETFINTSQGKQFLPEIKNSRNPSGTLEMKKNFGFDSLFNLNENEEFEDFKKPAEIVAFLDSSLKAGYTATLQPVVDFSPSTIDAMTQVNERLSPYVSDTIKLFITGELSIDKDWDDYVVELEKRGYLTIESLCNNAWITQK